MKPFGDQLGYWRNGNQGLEHQTIGDDGLLPFWAGFQTDPTLESMENTWFDRTFRDGEGNIVLAQTPNLPLLVWGAASLLQLILTGGRFHTALESIAFGSLFTWAWLELFQGVNYFRRALGLIVLVAAIWFKL